MRIETARRHAVLVAMLMTGLRLAVVPAAAQENTTVTVQRNGDAVMPVRVVAIDANGTQREASLSSNVGSFDGGTFPSGKGVNVFADAGAKGLTVLLVPDDRTPPPPEDGSKRTAAGFVSWERGARFVVDVGTATTINRNPPVPGQDIGGRFYLPVAVRGVIGSNDASEAACGTVNGDFRNANYTTFSCGSDGRPKGWEVAGGGGWHFNRFGVEVRLTRADRGDEGYAAQGDRLTPAPSITFAQDATFNITSWGSNFGVPINVFNPRRSRGAFSFTVTPYAGWRRYTNEFRVTNSLNVAGVGLVRSVDETTTTTGNASEFGIRFSVPSSLVGVEIDFSRIKYSGAFATPNTARFPADVEDFAIQIGGVFRIPMRW